MVSSRLASALAQSLCCAVVVFAAGCGSSSPVEGGGPGVPPGPVSCPDTGDLQTAASILPERLPDEATLRRWQETMVNLGPRITGSPAHKAWHEFIVREFKTAGLSVQRDPVPL
jgi:hypothetical protein